MPRIIVLGRLVVGGAVLVVCSSIALVKLWHGDSQGAFNVFIGGGILGSFLMPSAEYIDEVIFFIKGD